MLPATAENLSAALKAAEAGIYIFPATCAWDEATKKLNKRPAISGWKEKATTDASQIRAWWTLYPDAVPGIQVGRSRLFVIDLDRHPGAPDGVAAFKEFRGENPVPECPWVKTPSGGCHLYFRMPEGEPLNNRSGAFPAGYPARWPLCRPHPARSRRCSRVPGSGASSANPDDRRTALR